MRVIHFYPKNDDMITRHVSILAEGMRQSAEVKSTDSFNDFKQLCREFQPDIVHCHGCWYYNVARAVATARKWGARVVYSPHGALEPWVIEERYLKEKLHKTILWQRRAISLSYAVIAFGKMERKYMEELKWNPRIETIRNSMITNSITSAEMCSQTFAVYQKVLDSSTLEHMDEKTRLMLSAILKAGITGDRRWVDTSFLLPPSSFLAPLQWRLLLIYAEHENIRNYVDYGMSVLSLPSSDIDTTRIAAYFPESYQRPQPLKELIAAYDGNETEYLLRMFQQIHRQPLLLHLIELARELRRDSVDDDRLQEALEEHHLLDFAQSLMTVLREQTQLEEGFMPVSSVDNRLTQKIRNNINNHLIC